jgi:hypothetical protein
MLKFVYNLFKKPRFLHNKDLATKFLFEANEIGPAILN